MITFERAGTDRKINWLSLLGLVLVPLLVAAGFLWATWGSSSRLDQVQAAVVNLDEPVTINKQTVPLGRQLAGGLVTGGDEPSDKNFSWVLTDQTDATQGLADGTYAAVVTIPKNFSQQATSYSKDTPSEIAPAQISVATSGVGGITDSAIAQAISTTATATLNTELTKQYLDQIYVGFNSTGEQFKTVAKAADDLSDGTKKLSDGIGKSADGAGEFANGLDQLDTGGKQLATGASQLSKGTGELATGLDKLADGTKQLPKQTRKLANGAQQSADGASGLADGVEELGGGLELNAAGLRGYASGVKQLRDGLQNPKAPSAQQQLQIQRQLAGCAQQANPLVCAYQAGAGATTAGVLTALNDQPGSADNPKVPAACPRISQQKRDTTPGLLRAAVQLCSGGNTISSKVNQGLVPGTAKLSGGLQRLADGTDQLADGLKPLSTGIGKTTAGADKLATGASQLSTGVTGLSGGITAAAEGADKLADGLGQLNDGGSKLADGTKKLSDGLATGADKIPSYDKTLRTRLAQTVATPVTQERPDSLFSNTALTSLLAVVALWLGGLASFLVLRAIPARTLTSMKPAWRLTAEALLPAAVISAVQGLVLAGILRALFDLGAGATLGLAGLLVLAGLSFAALNQALVAWLGGVGRFISVGLVVLTAAAATTSALPAALQGLVPYLPLTPALDGAKALVTGADGVGGPAGVLLAWLLIGTVASLIAVARHKQLPALALSPAAA